MEGKGEKKRINVGGASADAATRRRARSGAKAVMRWGKLLATQVTRRKPTAEARKMDLERERERARQRERMQDEQDELGGAWVASGVVGAKAS